LDNKKRLLNFLDGVRKDCYDVNTAIYLRKFRL